MKAIKYGLIVLTVLLVAPAYASDCSEMGYKPFADAIKARENNRDVKPSDSSKSSHLVGNDSDNSYQKIVKQGKKIIGAGIVNSDSEV